ncbi:MAG: hypothetical protein AB7F65_03005 [Dehalococcoidia bacterium]
MAALPLESSSDFDSDAGGYRRANPRAVRRSQHQTFYLALESPKGQLSFRIVEVWGDCMAAVRLAYPHTSWSLHPGHSEHIWEIRTGSTFDDLRRIVEKAVGERLGWVLLDPSLGRCAQWRWLDSDISALQIALRNWEREEAPG